MSFDCRSDYPGLTVMCSYTYSRRQLVGQAQCERVQGYSEEKKKKKKKGYPQTLDAAIRGGGWSPSLNPKRLELNGKKGLLPCLFLKEKKDASNLFVGTLVPVRTGSTRPFPRNDSTMNPYGLTVHLDHRAAGG